MCMDSTILSFYSHWQGSRVNKDTNFFNGTLPSHDRSLVYILLSFILIKLWWRVGGFTLSFLVINSTDINVKSGWVALAATALKVGINWGLLFLISFRQSWASFISALLPRVSVLPPAYLVNLVSWLASPALSSPIGPSHLPSIFLIFSRLLSSSSGSRGCPVFSSTPQNSPAISPTSPLSCLWSIFHFWT